MKKRNIIICLLLLMSLTICAYAADLENDSMVDTVESYAYMDLESADESTQAKIIEARNELIFNQSWTADGTQCFVLDSNGTVIEELPSFSELFPSDWDLPAISTMSENSDNCNSSAMPQAMQQEFLGSVFLRVPSNTTNTSPFHSCSTYGFVGTSSEYYLGAVYVSGSIGGGGTYNVGISNANTGVSLAHKTRLNSGNSLQFNPNRICERIAFRASTYTTPGSWTMRVDVDYLTVY